MPESETGVLQLNVVVTGYGKKQVVNGVTLCVQSGEIAAIIGHNGAGKSTLLRATFGLLPIWSGEIALFGNVIRSATPRDMHRLAVGYVPQGNRVFSDLTVRENLEVGGTTISDKRQLAREIDRVLETFALLKPHLQQLAGSLSGGEKQMLAMSMALILSPRVLLLDEPSLGLASSLVTDVLHRVKTISRDSGVACLIVEQKVREVLEIADTVTVLRSGRVSFSGAAGELRDESRLREVYL